MKGLVLLLLSLLGYAEGESNCRHDEIIRNNCTVPSNFLLCIKSICTYCRNQDCSNTSMCEAQINSFFNDYCDDDAADQSTTPVIDTRAEGVSIKVLAAALGALIGLFLVVIALVIAGWVWTCWIMKIKNKRTQLCKKCQCPESEEEQFCPNQIFEMTTTQPVEGTAIEQLLHSVEVNGQSKDNKGYRDVKRVENFYTSSESSTQSSLQEEQAVNRVEEGESEEKHVYHVLEKPGGDDYEDPDKDLEDNTATEYEIPIPLN